MKKTIASIVLALTLTAMHGLASANPLATNDQLYAENLAAYIVTAPEVQAEMLVNSQIIQTAIGQVSAEQMAYLQDALDEQAFSNAVTAQSGDANYPKFVSCLAVGHSWHGMDVPGYRWAFDNPDTIYRQVSIDPNASYVVRGKKHKHGPVDENYSLMATTGATISNLTGKKLVVNADGTFEITLDSNPANGRQNHIQTTSTASYLLVRNTITDWAKQKFDNLTIERVSGPPLPAPKTYDDLVKDTVAIYSNVTYPALRALSAKVAQPPVNTLPAITHSNTSLVSQLGTYSHWQLADDEALIVKVNLGGSKYFVCPVYNKWLITTDYINHTQSLNNAQAIPNPNGTYTFVISVKDPGVYNWVDTVGMHEGVLNLRWQGVPKKVPATGDVSATMRLVKLADLKSILPAHTKWVTKQERKQQLRERREAYAKRYAE